MHFCLLEDHRENKITKHTLLSHGMMHPVWNRCLQGISLTVSCSSNSSKHTGHFSALSVKWKKELEESSRRMIVMDTKDQERLIQSNLLPMPNTIKHLSKLLPIILLLMFLCAIMSSMNVFADDFEWAVCHLLVPGRWWPQEDSEPRLWLQEAGDAGPNPTNQMNLSLCQDPASKTYSRIIVKNG